ncbi:MAG: FkbM family methyltransferase [Pseudanabaenaceae cyanobacterium]
MKLRRLLRQIINTIRAEQKRAIWETASRNGDFLEVSTAQGKFRITAADGVISQSLYFAGNFELEFMQNAVALLREMGKCPEKGTGTILDIGGNIGVTSIGMLHTGEFARAVVVEPEPQNFALLQYNLALNGLVDKAICFPVAAADRNTELLFELSANNFGDHRIKSTAVSPEQLGLPDLYQESQRQITQVPARKLDDLLEDLPPDWCQDLSLLWMDIQGYEGYALKGATHLLSRGLPAVMEVWPYGLLRAGMNLEEFCSIVAQHWSSFWVWRRSRFVEYSMQKFPELLAEIGCGVDYENVVFSP